MLKCSPIIIKTYLVTLDWNESRSYKQLIKKEQCSALHLELHFFHRHDQPQQALMIILHRWNMSPDPSALASSMQLQHGDNTQCMPPKRSKRERFLHRRPPRARVKLQCTEMHALRGLIANHGNDTRGWMIIKWRCKLICLWFARYVLATKT